MLNRFFFVLLVFIGSLSIIDCEDEATITTPLPTTSTEPPKDILPVKVTKLIVEGVRQFLARLIAIFTYTSFAVFFGLLSLATSGCPRRPNCLYRRHYICCWRAELGSLPENIHNTARYVEVVEDNITEITVEMFNKSALQDLIMLKLDRTHTQNLTLGAFQVAVQLRHLTVIHNQLQILQPGMFQGPTFLLHLDLSLNSIHTILPGSFDGLHHLRLLDLHNNDIHLLSPGAFDGAFSMTSPFPSERKLDLSHNEIQMIQSHTFRNLKGVTEISLHRNKITLIMEKAFSGLPNARRLILSSNPIEIIHTEAFMGMINLKVLSIRINELTVLKISCFSGLQNLEVLDLFGNKLTHVPRENLQNLTLLKELTLSNGADIGILEKANFESQKNLTVLNLGKMKLNDIRVGAFQGLYILQELSLNMNLLMYLPENVFQELQRLSILDLGNNKLTHIPRNTIDTLRRLKILHLTNNPLKIVDVRIYEEIQFLSDLSIIPDRAFDFLDNVHYIKDIYMRGNINTTSTANSINENLQGIQIYGNRGGLDIKFFKQWPNLIRLRIYFSYIYPLQKGDFSFLSLLKEIYFQRCGLKNLIPGVFKGLTRVTKIVIKDNFLTEIQEGVFGGSCSETEGGLKTLEHLDLTRNRLSYIHPDAFRGNSNLNILNIVENQIVHLEFFKHLGGVEELYMNGNPLQTLKAENLKNLINLQLLHFESYITCDCTLKQAWQWIQKSRVIMPTQYCAISFKEWDDVLSLLDCRVPYTPSPHEESDLVGFLTLQMYVAPIVLGFIFLSGAIGNFFLLIVFALNPDMRKGPNACVLNLTIGDIMTLLVNLPLSYLDNASKTWNLGLVMCKVFSMFRDLSVGVSVYSVIALSLQRYMITVHSLKRKKGLLCLSESGTLILYITVVWGLAILMALPSLISATVQGGKCLSATTEYSKEYMRNIWTAQLMVYCVFPFCIIGVINIRISIHLRNSVKKMPGEIQAVKQVQERTRLAGVITALAIVFCISYIPNFLIRVLVAWYLMDQTSISSLYYSFISYCLFFSNACFNPIALGLMSSKFRDLLLKYMLFWRKTSVASNSTRTDPTATTSF